MRRMPLAALLSLSAIVAVRAAHAAPQAAGCAWRNDHLSTARRTALLLHALTPGDETDLIAGAGTHEPYVFYTRGLKRFCIPPMGLEDGPAGVGDKLGGVTALPAGVALAATWDPSLARRYGAVIGAEQKAKGTAVDLGPTVNIDRDPRWGRSFESLSEDPYLAARIGVAEIRGIQSTGVMAQVKHFAVYNQETYRNTPEDDVIVSPRALHEIYLPAFRAAVRRAHVASIMCGYATIGGHESCGDKALLTGVLRADWGFRGFVTSDYQAIHATADAAAGADMEQPFATYFGARLTQAVAAGKLARSVPETMTRHILAEMFRFRLFDHPPQGSTTAIVATRADRLAATRIAEAGTVLLKNDGNVLPLDPGHGGTIAVIGPAASIQPVYAGGGSANVVPMQPVPPLAGIDHAPGMTRHVDYVAGLPADKALTPIPPSALSGPFRPTPLHGSFQAVLTAPETGTYVLGITNPCHCYAPTDLSLDGRELLSDPGTPPVSTYSAAVQLRKGERYRLGVTGAASRLTWATPSTLRPDIARAVAAARRAAVAIVVVADDTESEAADRPDLDLPSAQNRLIEAVSSANPHTVVVIDAGAPVAMPWLGKVAAVVDAWYPGETNGTALAAILFGKADPGGHLPVTFPAHLADMPTAPVARFPGTGGRVDYSEGIDVGYRWYSAHHVRPLFPFGFGLSYTHFAFSDLKVVSGPGDGTRPVVVSALVTNAGKVAGSDVAQLYLRFPRSAGEAPLKLVGFRRVRLAPGQSKRLRFTVTPRQTWWWHGSGWTASPGTYRLYLGDAADDAHLAQRVSFPMPQTVGARNVLVEAPEQAIPGQPVKVKVSLSAGGEATLRHVRLRLDAPAGWRVSAIGSAAGEGIQPGEAVRATFTVTPPGWAAAGTYALRAVAQLGARHCTRGADAGCVTATRDSGAMITLAAR